MYFIDHIARRLSTLSRLSRLEAIALLCIISLASLLHPSSSSAQSTYSKELTKFDRFDRVVLAEGINMTIIMADKPKITIKGERSVVLQVVCEVRDGELNVYATKFKYKKSPRIDIILEIDSALTSIYATSGNKVRCESPMPCENLTLTARYGSDFIFHVNSDFIKVKAETGSDIRLIGNVRKADIFADNTCTIRAFKLMASTMSVACTQQCEVDVTATDVLFISSSNRCVIRYKGNPPTTQINTLKYSTARRVAEDAI